ncbi:MAG: phage tail length tape measure family protein [Roseibium sp.]
MKSGARESQRAISGIGETAETAASDMGRLSAAANATAFAARAQENAFRTAGLAAANSNRLAASEVNILAQQISDGAIQVASGQSLFTAIIQQGSQVQFLLGSKGVNSIGGSLGLLKQGLIGFLNPINLAIVGLAGGAAAASLLYRTIANDDSATQALETQGDLIEALVERYDEVGVALDRLRGKQGLVIIDEAAFVENLKELLKAAMAFLMWGGQVVVCSTHDGTENEFNIQIQDILSKRSPYAHLRVDLDDALKDGLFERICLVQSKDWTAAGEADWRQKIIDFYADGADEELFCIPSMGSGAWLSAPLIEARMSEGAPVLRLELPANYLHLNHLQQSLLIDPFLAELTAALELLPDDVLFAFGFDFTRVADLTVGCLLALEKNLKRREVLSFELRNVPGSEQKLITKTVLDAVRTRLVGAAFDATGMGWTVAEDMGRLFGLREDPNGAGIVMPIHFSQTWYRIEMPPLKAAFEDDMIELGADRDHVSDLRLVKMIRGIASVPPVRDGEKGKKRHGDYAIALALAHYASRMQWREFDYTPVSTLPGRHDEVSDFGDRDGPYHMASLRNSRGNF